MKLSVEFKNLNAEDTQSLWLKMKQLKKNVEKRLGESFILKVDPVKEQFYVIPTREIFNLHFNLSSNTSKKILKHD